MNSVVSLDPRISIQGERFSCDEIDLEFCPHSSSSLFDVVVVADNILTFLDADFAVRVFQFISRVCYSVTNTPEFWIERIRSHGGVVSLAMTSTAPSGDHPVSVDELRRYFFRRVRYHSCSEMRWCSCSQNTSSEIAGSVMFGAPVLSDSNMFAFQHALPFCNTDSSYTFSLRVFFPSEIARHSAALCKIDITAEWYETYEVPSPSPDDIDPGFEASPGRIQHIETMHEARVSLCDLFRNVPISTWIEIVVASDLRVHERGRNKATQIEFKWTQLTRGEMPAMWVDG